MVKHDVMFVAEAYLKKKGSLKGERLSNGWWDKFLRRKSNSPTCVGDSTAGVRLDAVNSTNIDNYLKIHSINLALQIIQRLFLIWMK